MSDVTITKSVFFAAPRETVWSFLTEKDKLALWFHPAEADLADGEDYALIETAEDGAVTRICWGTVLEMERYSRMVWAFTAQPLGGALTTVTWTLEDVSGGTKLSLLHEGIGAAAGEAAMKVLLSMDAGWDEHFGRLRRAAA